MKKTVIMLFTLMMTASVVCAAPERPIGPPESPVSMGPVCHRPAPPRIDLDKRLKLTDAQKTKARDIRMSGEKIIQPLFEQLIQKQQEKRALLNSNINKKEQIEMIDDLNEQIITLKKQIRDARIENTKEFEAILTPKQKRTLTKLKMNARRKMNHKYLKHRHFQCAKPLVKRF